MLTKCAIVCLQGQQKGAIDYMSEREKQIVEKLKDAIPRMSDFDKGYILGKVENMAEQNQQSEHADTENGRKE